jgi:hypothetical protein
MENLNYYSFFIGETMIFPVETALFSNENVDNLGAFSLWKEGFDILLQIIFSLIK